MRPKSTLDDFDISVLSRTMMSFHTEFEEMPTIKKLEQVLTEKKMILTAVQKRCVQFSGNLALNGLKQMTIVKHWRKSMTFKCCDLST